MNILDTLEPSVLAPSILSAEGSPPSESAMPSLRLEVAVARNQTTGSEAQQSKYFLDEQDRADRWG